jgi:hypothetical protein
VLPEELAEAAVAGGWLAGARVTERFAATLKGLKEAVGIVRVSAKSPAGGSQSAALG